MILGGTGRHHPLHRSVALCRQVETQTGGERWNRIDHAIQWNEDASDELLLSCLLSDHEANLNGRPGNVVPLPSLYREAGNGWPGGRSLMK